MSARDATPAEIEALKARLAKRQEERLRQCAAVHNFAEHSTTAKAMRGGA